MCFVAKRFCLVCCCLRWPDTLVSVVSLSPLSGAGWNFEGEKMFSDRSVLFNCDPSAVKIAEDKIQKNEKGNK